MFLGLGLTIHGQGSVQGGGGASLPADGMIGLWNIADYATLPYPYLPNSQGTMVPPANLFFSPRRLFATSASFFNMRTSFVDAGLSAPDGTSDASTLTIPASAWIVAPFNTFTLADSGTYTLAARARRNTGSDQQFIMGYSGSMSGTKTATAAWQWFTYVASRTAGVQNLNFMASFDGAAGIDIQTMDWMMLPGSVTADVDLEAAVAACLLGDIVLSKGTGITFASGALDMAASSRFGIGQFPVPQSFTAFTAQALVSKTVAGSGYQSIISSALAYNIFSLMTEEGGASQSYFNNAFLQNQGAPRHAVTLLNQGYHLITVKYDGAAFTYFIDDCIVNKRTVSAASVAFRDAAFSNTNIVTSLFSGLKYTGAVALWDRALTNAEIYSTYTVQKAMATAAGLTANRARFLLGIGDSITDTITSYFFIYLPNAAPMVQARSFAVGGAELSFPGPPASAVEQWADALTYLPPVASRESGKFIVSIMIGTNFSEDVPTFLANYAALCDSIRAEGVKLVVCTLIAKNSDIFNARRALINADMRTWVGVHCDAVADFGADAIMGDDATSHLGFFDPTYYADGVHPTAAGHARLEAIFRPAVNSV